MKRTATSALPPQTSFSTGTPDKKARVQEDPNVMEVRVLVTNHEVGCIIGKAGSNIRRIREQCSVYISILGKKVDGITERVMNVKGLPEDIALALHEMAKIIVQAKQERVTQTGESSEESKESYQVQFLVHSALVGGIIGKKGALIQETQATTQARVHISSDPLPQSTEKTVTVSGPLDNVHAANRIIIQQIKENELRPGQQNRPYTPSPFYNAQAGPGSIPAYPDPYSAPYAAPSPYGYGTVSSYGAPPYGYLAPLPYSSRQSGGRPQPSTRSGQMSKQKIVIPTVCAGSVIGRGGSIISGIKQQSGCFISIANAEPHSPDERMVTITGSAQGIQTAVYLIRQVVEQFESPEV